MEFLGAMGIIFLLSVTGVFDKIDEAADKLANSSDDDGLFDLADNA